MSESTTWRNADEQGTPAAPSPARLPTRTVVGLFAAVAVVLLAATVVAVRAQGGPDPSLGSTSESGSAWRGTELGSPIPRPDFVLTDTSGKPYDFRRETAGKLTLLAFGYLSCPDVCPIQMATIAGALRHSIGVEPIVVFVTTDPRRDTLEKLRAWLDHFDTRFIGLTGTDEQIQQAEQSANIALAVANPANADGSYTVGHATQVEAFTADDLAHVVYPFGVRQEDWVEDLPRLANHPTWSGS